MHLHYSYSKSRNDFDPNRYAKEASNYQSLKALELAEELQLDDEKDIQGYRFIYTLGLRLTGKDEDIETEGYEPQPEIIGSFCAKYSYQRTLTKE